MTSDRLLWAGVMVPPVTWAINLCLSYFLSSFACGGIGPLLVHLVSVVSLAVIAIGGVMSWRILHRDSEAAQREAPPEETRRAGRQHFMAAAGVGFALIFAFTVAAQWYPAFLIEPCRL